MIEVVSAASFEIILGIEIVARLINIAKLNDDVDIEANADHVIKTRLGATNNRRGGSCGEGGERMCMTL